MELGLGIQLVDIKSLTLTMIGGGGHVKEYRAYKGGNGGAGMILVTINGNAAT